MAFTYLPLLKQTTPKPEKIEFILDEGTAVIVHLEALAGHMPIVTQLEFRHPEFDNLILFSGEEDIQWLKDLLDQMTSDGTS